MDIGYVSHSHRRRRRSLSAIDRHILLFIFLYIYIGTGRAPQISTGQLAHLPYMGTRCPRLFLNVKEQLAKSEDWLLIPPLPPRRYAAAAAAARRENISNRLMKFRTIGK